MKTALKVDIIKTAFILFHLLFVLTAINAWAQYKKDCGESPFTTEIIQIEKNESCYDIKLQVSFNDNVRYELSHVNFDFGKGIISNAWNSEGWKMEINSLDPTTWTKGIKVDDIQNFGKDPDFASFEVSFTFCPEIKCSLQKELKPIVAYKAGQCVYYECIDVPDTDQENPLPDDDNPIPDDQNPLTVTIDDINPTCNNPSGGSIHLSISGGTVPYSVIWNTGHIGVNLDNVSAGTYLYTITDANNNELTGEVILENPSGMVIEEFVTNPDCQSKNNGAIDLTVTGGTAPYTFLWGNNSTEQNLSNLLAGTYAVTVTDANGCSEQKMIPLYNKTNIILDANITQPSCQNETSGSIELTVTGGEGPYDFSWSNNMNAATIDGLDDNNYRVNVTDVNGCSVSKTYGISTDMGIDAFALVKKTDCLDNPYGEIDLTVTGGTGVITVEWSNVAWSEVVTGEDITGLTSGNYTATITDEKGCTITYNTSVLKDDIKINYQGLTIPSCNGNEDGAIDVSISNATDPYTISWTKSSTNEIISSDEDISGLSADTYTIAVTDTKGCTAQRNFVVPEPNPIQVSYEINTDQCTGDQDILLNVTGGNMEYTYLWSDGSTSSQLIDVTPGTYTVIVTDKKLCSASQEIIVEEPAQNLSCLISDPTSDVLCSSINNILTSNAPGAIGYSWSISSSDNSWEITSSTNQDQIEFSAGNAGSSATITLTASYEGGCEVSCEKVIEVCIEDQNPDDNTCDPPTDDTSDDGTTDDGTTDDGTTDDGSSDGGTTDDGSSDDGSVDDGSSDGGTTDDGTGGDGEGSDNDIPCACFFTYPVEISKVDGGYQYAIEVGHNDCRYDLSHLTIEIPDCFKIIDYSNSMGWKMEIVHNDPTTGLSGIKIDDIPSFGKDENSSFMVYLKLTSYDQSCYEDLACFAPVVAYKASTCVSTEYTTSECAEGETDYTVNTYPNPTHDYVKVNFDKCDKTASYEANLLDFHGDKIETYKFRKGYNKEYTIDLSSRKDGLYLLEVKSSKGKCSIHRVIKN